MKKSSRQKILLVLAAVLTLSSGCVPPMRGNGETVQTEARQETGGQQKQSRKEGIPAEGDRICGFTVDAVWEDQALDGDLISFTHENSGARLLYVKNDDPELTFSVSYHTPYVDETDANHIFEHAIMAASEKYPSSDLFFDMAAKSYNTFLNAFTYDTFTAYPFSTESEEQLFKLMDAYLSCMTAPDILKNENIFRREALRYELQGPDEEIRMAGTVYAEDFGKLTDVSEEAKNNVADALFPGQYASNMIGRAHRNYRDLSYEDVRTAYDRWYHFDNSLFFLYGDMDYEKVLDFLDREYLSGAGRNGTDLSAYTDGPSENGFSESTVYAPAYLGDKEEQVSQIDYAFSLEQEDWEDLLAWNLVARTINEGNTPFDEELSRQGIDNQTEVSVNLYSAKPYLTFRLYYAQPEQSKAFRKAVDQTLSRIAGKGIGRKSLEQTVRKAEMEQYLARDQGSIGVELFPDVVNYWTHTGKLDYFRLSEQVLDQLKGDRKQKAIRKLAKNLKKSGRSALVTTVPRPGMAEELLEERDSYLAEMKASMTKQEQEQLIRDTEAFRKWNETKVSNSDFTIDPENIPERKTAAYTRSEKDGITYYLAPAKIEKVGSYSLYFDTGAFSNEELHDLELYKFLVGNMATDQYGEEELFDRSEKYLYGLSFSNAYPETGHPMTAVSWKGMTEDYEDSLTLLLDMMSHTDFSDGERIREILARYGDDFDRSRSSEPVKVAQALAGTVMSTYAYKEVCEGQDFYRYLMETKEKLEQDENYGTVLRDRLDRAAGKLVQRGRLVFACAAPENDLERIRSITEEYAGKLPVRETEPIRFVFPERGGKTAAAVESPDQCTVMAADAYRQPDFEGRYVPFLMAVSDHYLVPVIRFRMGAYSSGASFDAYSGGIAVYSINDPNAAETVKALERIPDVMAEMELTEEELKGYILTGIASAGPERGVLKGPMEEMAYEIFGRDGTEAEKMIHDMKNAALSDQQAAAEAFRRAFAEAGTATVGNEAVLRRDRENYDRYISLKETGKTES